MPWRGVGAAIEAERKSSACSFLTPLGVLSINVIK